MTAKAVFEYVVTYLNFVAASDAPFNMTEFEREQNLMRFVDADGSATFGGSKPGRKQVGELLASEQLINVDEALIKQPHLSVITDDNMVTEFKNPGSVPFHYLVREELSWKRLFSRITW